MSTPVKMASAPYCSNLPESDAIRAHSTARYTSGYRTPSRKKSAMYSNVNAQYTPFFCLYPIVSDLFRRFLINLKSIYYCCILVSTDYSRVLSVCS